MRGGDFASVICPSFRLGGRAAVVSFTEPCGLRVLFGTEPPVRIVQARVRTAGLQMVDAEIAGDAGADRVLALDAAAGRHRDIIREQGRADLAVAVSPA